MKKIISTLILPLLVIGCNTSQDMNPLLNQFDTPYGVPPFDRIKNEHFLPAFEKATQLHDRQIQAITDNPDEPTFENTVVAFNISGQTLENVQFVLNNLRNANTNDSLDAIAEKVVPVLSAHQDQILMNGPLFERIKYVYDHKDSLGLNPEETILLEKTYKKFSRNGANLSSEDKIRLAAINQELAKLTLAFSNNVLKETNDFVLLLDKEEDLAGLPDFVKAILWDDAKALGYEGRWAVTMQKTNLIPFLEYSSVRPLREKALKGYIMRGNNDNANDNKAIIDRIVNLRLEKAKLLGYPTYAHYVLEGQMAKTPENAYALTDRIWAAALQKAKNELADLQKLADKDGVKIETWDWWYYAEKVRQQKYALDQEELRPYFSLENVIGGVFAVANRLFGLQFERNDSLPKPTPEAIAYQVRESDGRFVGVLYMDLFPSAGKVGGANMEYYVYQNREQGKEVSPVITLLCNFPRAVGGTPSLLSLDHVNTLFHEFGHALNGLLSKTTYRTLTGTNTATDYAELQSQIMERWAMEPEVLKMYAKHWKTAEPIPDSLIAKLQAVGTFNQGFETVEYLSAALLDMDWHSLDKKQTLDVNAFEEKALSDRGMMEEIVVRYRSPYFMHIFGSYGYSALYYGYIWSEVLDADVFESFWENGLFDPETAARFRKYIMEPGGSADEMESFRAFKGRDPQVEPLLRSRGLI